jgi:hypothetical protein
MTGLAVLGTLRPRTAAEDKAAPNEGLADRIDKRVQAWQPTRDERLLDSIGWASDIRDALHLARESKRPIFLFTYSGSAVREHAMALQRC